MSELEARFRVRLEGKEELSNFFKKSANDAKEYSKAVTGALKDSAKQIAGFAASTSKSLASLALGDIGIASQAKNVLAFRDSIAQLTVTAGKGADYMDGLREQIHDVSKASNQMQSDVTEALEAFVERTGRIDIARRNLELYAKVATATGASLKDVAYVGAELSTKLKIEDPERQRMAFAILSAQSKAGAVEIRDLATKAPAIFSAASARFGVEGIEGLRGTGAIAQAFAAAHGGNATASMTATNIKQMFTDMQRRKSMINQLVGHDTTGQDPYETVKQLIVATRGDTEALLKNRGAGVFTPTALAGIGVMAKEYRDTGGFATFDKYKNVSADFKNVEADFALRSSTGQAKLNASLIRVAESADKNLGESFDRLANHADKLSSAYDFATRHMALTAGAFGLAVIGKNVGSALLTRAIAGHGGALLGGGAGGGAAAAPAAAAAAFATAAAPLFAALAGAAIGGAFGTALDNYTNGWFSRQGAKALGAVTGQADKMDAIVDAETGSHRAMLEERALQKRSLVYGYRKTGMGKGESIAAAQNVEELLRELINVNKTARQIIINEDKAGWEVQEGGTRSRKALRTRGAEGGN